jgi:hypothetical protein
MRQCTKFYNLSWWRWLQEVMVCQAASGTTSLLDAQKAGPRCLLVTPDPEKISAMAQYSTHPGRRTRLIRYLGAVVIPKCTSRA